ncbi:integrase (plasmid) [Azospirillum sp. TSH58]|nr:integrase [Azospirillum sp. TSH58]
MNFAAKNGPVNEIGASHILSYRMTLDEGTEWYLGTLRGFFRIWRDLSLPGIGHEVVTLLDKMRLKGNRKGEAVRTADPLKGAFSDIEYSGVVNALHNGFAKNKISMENYILVWLFLALGARPIQLAALKLSDFSVVRASDKAAMYILKVTRAKQRGQALRTEFKNRKILPDMGKIVEKFCHLSCIHWRELGLRDDMIPFFVNPANAEASEDFRYHCSSRDLAARVRDVFDLLNVTSERTGKKLNVTTRRFRYTIGTRAAKEGASELVIAEILDHSDTQNVGVYVEAVPEIIERIDKAMAIHLAPMAQAFAGVLIDGEEQATRAGDPTSRIVDPDNLGRPVGNCGTYGFCGAIAPIACYTCRNFQPWLDGPHEEVLDKLLNERKRIVDETGDATIASINDRLILACAEVIRLCEARKGGAAQ